MNSVAKRSVFWDNIKGILIFLVVFTHFMYDCRNNELIRNIVDIVYMFHMPVFIFVSGYLSKSSNSRSKESLIKLGVIYLIFNSVMMIFFGVTERSFTAVTPYYSTWYILALIVWRSMAEHISKVRYIVLWLTAIAVISGLWRDIDNTLAVSRIIAFSPFFMSGYLFDTDKMKKRISEKSVGTVLSGVGMLVAAAVVAVSAVTFFVYRASDLTINSYSDISDVIKRVAYLLFLIL